MWGTFLSEPLGIVAMVGRYPAIKLMPREPIRHLVAHFIIYPCRYMTYGGLVAVSAGYPPVTGMSLTCYAPFRRSPPDSIATFRVLLLSALPLDLHVLSLPLAFILSQDQTLLCIFLYFS